MTKRISLFIIVCFILYYNLGSISYLETSEARYAEISKEMVESGDLKFLASIIGVVAFSLVWLRLAVFFLLIRQRLYYFQILRKFRSGVV